MSKLDTSDIPEAGEAWFAKAKLVMPERIAKLEAEIARLTAENEALVRDRDNERAAEIRAQFRITELTDLLCRVRPSVIDWSTGVNTQLIADIDVAIAIAGSKA